MHNKINEVISNFTAMKKIFFVFCTPILIMMIFTCINNEYHINNYKSLISSSYSSELNSFLKETEKDMNRIIDSTGYFSLNSSINYVFDTDVKLVSNDTNYIIPAVSVLKSIKNTSPLIDSIAIYNKQSNFVLTQNGLYDANEYFGNVCHYENYSITDFLSYHTTNNTNKIFEPSRIINSGSSIKTTVVPLVFIPTGNSLVIYNINVNRILNDFTTHKFTDDSNIYLIDNATKTFYGKSASNVQEIEKQLVKDTDSVDFSYTSTIKLDKKKYLCIYSTERSKFWGFSYMVTIPYSSIETTVSKILITTTISLLALFAILIIISFISTMRLYTPWKKLKLTINSIDKTNIAKNTNIWDYVNSSVTNIANANESLKHDLSVTLPLSQKKYIIDILNNNTDLTNEEFKKIAFKYDYFISISIYIKIEEAFVLNNPGISTLQMQNNLYEAVTSIFAISFATFTLPSTNNTLYLLLNLENDSSIQYVNEIISRVRSILSVDSDSLTFFIGTGNIHTGIEGLKKTHNEAVSALLNSLDCGKIKISNSQKQLFDFNQENTLINFLIAGYTNKAKDFLNSIFNSVASTDIEIKQQTYTEIINILYKVMRLKKIEFTDIEFNNNFELLHSIISKSDEEIQLYIFNLVDKICDFMQISVKKIDIGEIIDYINNHFTEDIYLEMLAEKYNTSPKYLSKRIKQYLNISFKDYITQLRIDKAKKLLETTDIKIADLSQEVGYYNQSAFVRSFKLKEGIPPSEYKRLHT